MTYLQIFFGLSCFVDKELSISGYKQKISKIKNIIIFLQKIISKTKQYSNINKTF